MLHSTLAELADALEKKQISSEELTRLYIDRCHQFNDQLNCFITIAEESALTQAKQADERRSRNEATKLTGIPVAQKDIFCTKTRCPLVQIF